MNVLSSFLSLYGVEQMRLYLSACVYMMFRLM